MAQTDEARRISEAVTVLREIMDAGDQSVPRSIMQKAQGIAVFPVDAQGRLRRRRPARPRRDERARSEDRRVVVTGVPHHHRRQPRRSQIGGQAVDLILVIQNRRGLEQLVSNQFKIGADASVAAGPVGRDASASTDIQMRAQILSYSRTRGLFAGVSLNGTTIHQDRDANDRFYGMGYRTGQIVFDGLGGEPAPVGEWKAALAKYSTP